MHRIRRHVRAAGFTVVGLIMAAVPRLPAQGMGPRGATAKCQDGTYVRTKSEPAACRDHDGLETWYGLAHVNSGTIEKAGDPIVTLEEALTHQAPNTVLRGNDKGTIEDRFVPDSADTTLYASFMVYLDKVRQESGCRKVSAHCAFCPTAHRFYCTNAPQFLPLLAF